MSLLPAGQYRIGTAQPNGVHQYCLNGLYPGFSLGLSAGGMHPAIQNLEAHIGQPYEAISVGLPNGIGTPSTIVAALAGCPQFFVLTAPLVPLVPGGTSGSLSLGLLGNYDSLITNTYTYLVANGFSGVDGAGKVNIAMRLGWEMQGSFPWSVGQTDTNTGQPNTLADYKAMFARYVGLARAAGYVGWFDCNGGTADFSKLGPSDWWPGSGWTTGAQILGWDPYNKFGNAYTVDSNGTYLYGIGKDNMQAAWDSYIGKEFGILTTFARANGLLMGFGEMSQMYNPTDKYSTNDNSLFWQLMGQTIAANADVMAYACLYRQNQPSTTGTHLSENHAYWLSGGINGVPDTVTGTGPFPTNADGGTIHDQTSTGNTWVDTTSPNKQLGKAAYLKWMVPGLLQKDVTAPPVVVPSPTVVPPSRRKRRHEFALFG